MGLRFNKNKNFVESSGREFYFSEIVRYMHRHVRDLHSELRCVLLEELKIQPDVFPTLSTVLPGRVGVQVMIRAPCMDSKNGECVEMMS